MSACGFLSTSEGEFSEIIQSPPPITITVTAEITLTPSPTVTKTKKPATLEPQPSATTQPSATPRWKKKGPGEIVCPILLYHRIAIPASPSSYYVSPEEFRMQMQALKSWGYTSIPVSLLVEAIQTGAKLPERPVIITFDDGDATVYSQAYPIMREYGFSGVNYLVVNYVGTDGYMTVDHLKELAAAGWETGSHSMTHRDLTLSKNPEWEVQQSKIELKKLLGVHIGTFAYPFGQMNADLRLLVSESYIAGIGLGAPVSHSLGDLFYLWRRPVDPGWDAQKFGSYLPWNSPPE